MFIVETTITTSCPEWKRAGRRKNPSLRKHLPCRRYRWYPAQCARDGRTERYPEAQHCCSQLSQYFLKQLNDQISQLDCVLAVLLDALCVVEEVHLGSADEACCEQVVGMVEHFLRSADLLYKAHLHDDDTITLGHSSGLEENRNNRTVYLVSNLRKQRTAVMQFCHLRFVRTHRHVPEPLRRPGPLLP